MMNPKYLISSVAAAMVVVGGLAYAQTTDPSQQPSTDATTPVTPNTSTTDSTLQPSTSSTDTSSSTSDAPVERDAQADRN